MADGYVARRLKSETKAGALMDSIADIVFVVCCTCKLISFLKIPSWLWYMALVIVGIKFVNQISSWVVHRRFHFPHTTANKLTGFMLFVSIPLLVCYEVFIPLIITSALAVYAAIHEGHYIRTK